MTAKVFHVVTNKVWGGGEQFVLDLSRRLVADGWDICLFCRPIPALTSPFSKANLPLRELPLKGITDFWSAWKMAKVLKQAGPCIVHLHNFKDAFMAAYARKLSGNKQVRIIVARHLAKKGKKSALYTWLYRQIDAICFVSEMAKQTFLSSHPPIDPQHINVIHNSIYLPRPVTPCPIRQEFHIADHLAIAMYHGRLHKEKGLDTLIEAIGQIREKPFVMLVFGQGSTDYTNHLKEVIQAQGLQQKVIMAGFQESILPYVASADFGVVPSVVRESFSLAALEYLSQGHTVVATNHGGQTEFLTDRKNSLLVPHSDSHLLAKAIAELVDNPPLCQQLGQQGLKDFQSQYDYEHFYENMSRLYERIL